MILDATAGNLTATLPKLAIAYRADRGQRLILKRIDASANTCTIDGDGSETIDGAATYSLSAENDVLQIVANSADWNITNDPVALGTVDIADDAITGAKIADYAVDSNHFATGAIDTVHIAADQIDGTLIADFAVDSEHLATGAIDTVHIAADQIDGTLIADFAVDSEHLATGAIDTVHIAADQIDGTLVADYAIDSEHLATGAIDTVHIAADQIDGTLVADFAIDSEHLATGAIDTVHIAADQIDGTLIADFAVDSEHLATGAVDTVHIADGNVTPVKRDQAVRTLGADAAFTIAATDQVVEVTGSSGGTIAATMTATHTGHTVIVKMLAGDGTNKYTMAVTGGTVTLDAAEEVAMVYYDGADWRHAFLTGATFA